MAPGAAAEVERLRALVADQHHRLRVARSELAPIGGAQVIAPPMSARCGKLRLSRPALAQLIEQAQARIELMDSALGNALWAHWPEPRPAIPVLRPSPGLPAYGLRGVPGLPNLVLALFLRAPAEIEAAIARTLAEQRTGEPFLPVFLTCQPDFAVLREQRLAFEYFPFVLEDSAPAPEPRWAAYLVLTLELTMRRWGVRQIVTLWSASATPRLRLAQRLISEGHADEAACLVRDLPADGNLATRAQLAALALAQGRLAEAADGARAVLGAASLPADLLVAAAGTLAEAGDPEAADAALVTAIDAGAMAVELRLARARLAEARGRSDLAVGYWRSALDLDDGTAVRLGLIRALRGEARFAEAERVCRLVLAASPKDSHAAAELARIAQDAGDPIEAESRWHGALLVHPGHEPLLLGLARALVSQHRFDEGRALVEGLIQREPDRPAPRAALVRLLLAEGNLADAVRHATGLMLGEAHEAMGDFAQAAQLYGEAQGEPGALLAAARLAARQGDLDKAHDAYAAILAASGGVEARIGLAEVLAEAGRDAEAVAMATEAVSRAPNQPRAHLARATVAEIAGRLDDARLALLEARAAMPWRVEPLLHLAQLALRHGERDAVAERGAALIAAHPRCLAARLVAFDCAMAGGRIEYARALLAPLADELPRHREVERRLARLDWQDGAVETARGRWQRITRHDRRIHGEPDRIERLDNHPLPASASEIRLFMLVRNERIRLPWLLRYYRGLGVSRFLILDNGSNDGTVEWLLARGRDVHVFGTEASFARSGAGMRWINHLLDRHGCGAWCLTIDADEVLVYPGAESVPLPALTAYLDQTGAEAMAAPMIDFYAAAPLDTVRYEPGESLIEAFPWFDATGYVRRDSNDFPYFRLHGGARARLFHAHAAAGPVLQKVPLIRWQEGIKYTSSKHTAFPCRLADISGALLHFKYLPDFAEQVRAEVARGQHYLGAKEYRGYQRRLASASSLSPLGPVSCRYRDSRQLVELGLIATSPEYESHVRGDA